MKSASTARKGQVLDFGLNGAGKSTDDAMLAACAGCRVDYH